MTIQQQFCFEAAVQSLARVLARIKPTPWEKVFEISAKVKVSLGKSINYVSHQKL